jgi:hypothetical protein
VKMRVRRSPNEGGMVAPGEDNSMATASWWWHDGARARLMTRVGVRGQVGGVG